MLTVFKKILTNQIVRIFVCPQFKHYGGHKGAHVVGHYADGARLVGLTENELYTQLKGLKQQSNLSKLL